jgi:hypothetical protein
MSRTSLLIAVFAVAPLIVFSQGVPKTVYAQDAIGKADSGVAWMGKRLSTLKGVSRSTIASLKKSLDGQSGAFYDMPQLRPPIGFSTRTLLTTSFPAVSKRRIPNAALEIENHYLIVDPETGGVKVSDGGVLLVFETNSIEHFCHQQGSYAHDCAELNIPDFFEEIPVTDSTADYIELNYRYYKHPHSVPPNPIRIVRRNDKPVFVPFTRKNFIEYLIAKSAHNVKVWKDIIADNQKNIQEARKNMADPVFSQVSAALSTSVKTMEGQTADAREKVKGFEQEEQRFRALLHTMPPAEANAPARVSDKGEFGSLESLVPLGRQEGDALCKVNPDYFDASPNAPGAQVIIVYYHWEILGVYTHDPNYLQQKIIDIFHQLDYHRLKESMLGE